MLEVHKLEFGQTKEEDNPNVKRIELNYCLAGGCESPYFNKDQCLLKHVPFRERLSGDHTFEETLLLVSGLTYQKIVIAIVHLCTYKYVSERYISEPTYQVL